MADEDLKMLDYLKDNITGADGIHAWYMSAALQLLIYLRRLVIAIESRSK